MNILFHRAKIYGFGNVQGGPKGLVLDKICIYSNADFPQKPCTFPNPYPFSPSETEYPPDGGYSLCLNLI